MRKYIIGYYTSNSENAGGKFPSDIETIFLHHGYKFIKVHELYIFGKKIYRPIIQFIMDFFRLLCIKKGSLTVYIDQVQPRLSTNLVFFMLKRKRCYIVDFLEDVDILRNSYETNKCTHSIKLLNSCNFIISQNKVMTGELQKKGVDIPTTELEILDFLSEYVDINRKESIPNKWKICYGGNLNFTQSGFIFKLPNTNSLIFNLYGPNLPEGALPSNVRYLGKFDAENCVGNIEGDWGLVWNGSSCSIDKNDSRSTYYNYVCPHKLSMYLLCGMPVIVYSESAMSSFVKKYNCGITIDTIYSLEHVLSKITGEEYNQLKEGALAIAYKISKGFYTGAAIDKLEEHIKDRRK